MSVTHFWFGLSAVKSRSSTLGAGCFVGSLLVVVGVNAFETRLFRPISRIARATVLRQADSRSSRRASSRAILKLP